MLVTTLNEIKKHDPCESGWKTLLRYLGKTKADDEPLKFLTILRSNGFDDALWCMRSAPEYSSEWRMFAAWCIEQIKHITDESIYLTDRVAVTRNAAIAAEYASEKAADIYANYAAEDVDDANDDNAWDAFSVAHECQRAQFKKIISGE